MESDGGATLVRGSDLKKSGSKTMKKHRRRASQVVGNYKIKGPEAHNHNTDAIW